MGPLLIHPPHKGRGGNNEEALGISSCGRTGRRRMSMRFLTKASVLFDRLVNLLAILAGILLIFVILSVCAEVFLRYFLGRPTVWVVEISGYALLYITFLVVAWVQRRGGHVRMDLVIDRLNPMVRSVVNVITSLICTIACFILTCFG